jgi:hypothetical protein
LTLKKGSIVRVPIFTAGDLRFQALNDMGENRPAGKRQQAFLTADLPPAKTMPTTGSRAFIPGL